jgi:hypothetical protein
VLTLERLTDFCAGEGAGRSGANSQDPTRGIRCRHRYAVEDAADATGRHNRSVSRNQMNGPHYNDVSAPRRIAQGRRSAASYRSLCRFCAAASRADLAVLNSRRTCSVFALASTKSIYAAGSQAKRSAAWICLISANASLVLASSARVKSSRKSTTAYCDTPHRLWTSCQVDNHGFVKVCRPGEYRWWTLSVLVTDHPPPAKCGHYYPQRRQIY